MSYFSELDQEDQERNSSFMDDDEQVEQAAMDGQPDAFEEEEDFSPVTAAPVSGETPASAAVENSAAPEQNSADTQETNEEDEDAKRKAHEAAEAQRKAEWEARQQAKKQARQEALDKIKAMNDQELMQAAMKRVSADTEKLTRRNMKECVSEYIQTKCLEDMEFARMTMNPCKSMIHCFQYINRKAWEYVQDEMKANGIQPGPGAQGYGSDVPDDLCYQWSEDYFRDPDAKEDQEQEEEFVPRPYHGGTAKSTKSKAKKIPAKKAEEKKPEPKKTAGIGQLSLGDFNVPVEKAG
jgi:hypothetical protein